MNAPEQIESIISGWRSIAHQRSDLDARDIADTEAQLRTQIDELSGAGLSPDEAFLVAAKRLGQLDKSAIALTDLAWQQATEAGSLDAGPQGLIPAASFAGAAAVAVAAARTVAGFDEGDPEWLYRNASLFVLPFLACYLAYVRRLRLGKLIAIVVTVAAAILVLNLYPFVSEADTELLAAGHVTVVLWFVVASAHMSGAVRDHEKRMDFVRFSGDWLIYYVLIALSGGVLTGISIAVLEPVGVDPDSFAGWVLPMGAAGAVVISAWLVDRKDQPFRVLAPLLTKIFTPLFATMLVVAVVAYVANGLVSAFDRDQLVVFDSLMVVVTGLVLFDLSGRSPKSRAGLMDGVQLSAVIGALLLDLGVVVSMLSRIGDLGFTPNRTVALGLNLLLACNLVGSAWWSLRFLTGRAPLSRLQRWHTSYLPVFGAWAAAVVVLVPPIFGFV